jgi:hypothetical protein
MLGIAQAQSDPQRVDPQQPTHQKEDPHSPPIPGSEYSGMYSFLRDGEFVQFTVQDGGHLIGFVSRYADPEGNGGFVEHFIKSGALDGNQLSFTTDRVKGVSFEFKGKVDRGEGQTRDDEAYYVLRGSLTEITVDEAKRASSHSQEVVLKSFPKDLASPQTEKK